MLLHCLRLQTADTGHRIHHCSASNSIAMNTSLAMFVESYAFSSHALRPKGIQNHRLADRYFGVD